MDDRTLQLPFLLFDPSNRPPDPDWGLYTVRYGQEQFTGNYAECVAWLHSRPAVQPTAVVEVIEKVPKQPAPRPPAM